MPVDDCCKYSGPYRNRTLIWADSGSDTPAREVRSGDEEANLRSDKRIRCCSLYTRRSMAGFTSLTARRLYVTISPLPVVSSYVLPGGAPMKCTASLVTSMILCWLMAF